jgi:hypothetical protein
MEMICSSETSVDFQALYLPRASRLDSCSVYSPTLKMEAMFLRNVGWFSSPLLVTCFNAGFFLGLFYDLEDGSYMFLRNVG